MNAVVPTFIELVRNSKQHSDWEDAKKKVKLPFLLHKELK
jgi:hypothetical protein